MRSWTQLKSTIAPIALATMLALSGAALADQSDRFKPAAPEPGIEIPAATIKFGMRPYADNTFYIIGMKKGWFDDVGINFDPAPYGLKANDSNVTTLLLNGQLDIISEFCPLMLPTYKDATQAQVHRLHRQFPRQRDPRQPRAQAEDLQGLYRRRARTYEEALKLALAPMKGKTLVGAPELSDRPFEEYLNKIAGAGFKLQVLDDAKSLVLAKAGREDFVNPEGAPIVYTLTPGGLDQSRRHRRPHQTRAGRRRFADRAADRHRRHRRQFRLRQQQPEHRAALPVGRLAHHRRDEEGPALYDLQAPFLNSMAGTSLDGKGVAATVAILHPFSTFDDDKQYYEDTKSATYYANIWTALIKNFEEHGIIPAGKVTPDDFVWGGPIWHQMVDYATKTDGLVEEAGRRDACADKQALLDKAKTFYADFDFLDAYRLALAASS